METQQQIGILPPRYKELPRHLLQLQTVYGFDFRKLNNLHAISTQEIVFVCGNNVCLLDIHNGHSRFIPGKDGGGIGAIAVDSSRSHLAVGEIGRNPSIYVYKLPTLELVCSLPRGTESRYSDVGFSPDGKQIVSVGDAPDYLLTVWDWQEEKMVLRSKAFSQEIFNARFSPFDTSKITTSGVGHICFWQMAETFTGLKLKGQIGKFGHSDLSDINDFAILPDGKVLSSSESGTLLLWEGNIIKCEIACPNHPHGTNKRPHEGAIYCVRYDKEANEFLTAGEDGYVRWWSFESIDNADAEGDSMFATIEPVYEMKVKISESTLNLSDESYQVPTAQIRGLCQLAPRVWLLQDANGIIWCIDSQHRNKKQSESHDTTIEKDVTPEQDMEISQHNESKEQDMTISQQNESKEQDMEESKSSENNFNDVSSSTSRDTARAEHQQSMTRSGSSDTNQSKSSAAGKNLQENSKEETKKDEDNGAKSRNTMPEEENHTQNDSNPNSTSNPNPNPNINQSHETNHATSDAGNMNELNRSVSNEGSMSNSRLTCVLCGHAGGVTSTAVSPYHEYPVMVSAGEDGTVRAWDLRASGILSGQLCVAKYNAPATCIRWLPTHHVGTKYTSNDIVVGFADGVVRVLSMRTARQTLSEILVASTVRSDQLARVQRGWLRKQVFKPHNSSIIDMQFSPDGQYLVTTSEDGNVFFLAFNEGKCLPTFESGATSAGHVPSKTDIFKPLGFAQFSQCSVRSIAWNKSSAFLLVGLSSTLSDTKMKRTGEKTAQVSSNSATQTTSNQTVGQPNTKQTNTIQSTAMIACIQVPSNPTKFPTIEHSYKIDLPVKVYNLVLPDRDISELINSDMTEQYDDENEDDENNDADATSTTVTKPKDANHAKDPKNMIDPLLLKRSPGYIQTCCETIWDIQQTRQNVISTDALDQIDSLIASGYQGNSISETNDSSNASSAGHQAEANQIIRIVIGITGDLCEFLLECIIPLNTPWDSIQNFNQTMKNSILHEIMPIAAYPHSEQPLNDLSIFSDHDTQSKELEHIQDSILLASCAMDGSVELRISGAPDVYTRADLHTTVLNHTVNTIRNKVCLGKTFSLLQSNQDTSSGTLDKNSLDCVLITSGADSSVVLLRFNLSEFITVALEKSKLFIQQVPTPEGHTSLFPLFPPHPLLPATIPINAGGNSAVQSTSTTQESNEQDDAMSDATETQRQSRKSKKKQTNVNQANFNQDVSIFSNVRASRKVMDMRTNNINEILSHYIATVDMPHILPELNNDTLVLMNSSTVKDNVPQYFTEMKENKMDAPFYEFVAPANQLEQLDPQESFVSNLIQQSESSTSDANKTSMEMKATTASSSSLPSSRQTLLQESKDQTTMPNKADMESTQKNVSIPTTVADMGTRSTAAPATTTTSSTAPPAADTTKSIPSRPNAVRTQEQNDTSNTQTEDNVSLEKVSIEPQDIVTESAYSIQDAKLKSEDDHRRALAEIEKNKVRSSINKLRLEFAKLRARMGLPIPTALLLCTKNDSSQFWDYFIDKTGNESKKHNISKQLVGDFSCLNTLSLRAYKSLAQFVLQSVHSEQDNRVAEQDNTLAEQEIQADSNRVETESKLNTSSSCTEDLYRAAQKLMTDLYQTNLYDPTNQATKQFAPLLDEDELIIDKELAQILKEQSNTETLIAQREVEYDVAKAQKGVEKIQSTYLDEIAIENFCVKTIGLAGNDYEYGASRGFVKASHTIPTSSTTLAKLHEPTSVRSFREQAISPAIQEALQDLKKIVSYEEKRNQKKSKAHSTEKQQFKRSNIQQIGTDSNAKLEKVTSDGRYPTTDTKSRPGTVKNDTTDKQRITTNEPLADDNNDDGVNEENGKSLAVRTKAAEEQDPLTKLMGEKAFLRGNSFNVRKQRRLARKSAIQALEQERPGADEVDPMDQEAVSSAILDTGAYSLKSDPEYTVPSHKRVDAVKKRQQMVLMEDAMRSLRHGFNIRVIELRELKRQLLDTMYTAYQRVRILTERIGDTCPKLPFTPTIMAQFEHRCVLQSITPENLEQSIQKLVKQTDLEEWPELRMDVATINAQIHSKQPSGVTFTTAKQETKNHLARLTSTMSNTNSFGIVGMKDILDQQGYGTRSKKTAQLALYSQNLQQTSGHRMFGQMPGRSHFSFNSINMEHATSITGKVNHATSPDELNTTAIQNQTYDKLNLTPQNTNALSNSSVSSLVERPSFWKHVPGLSIIQALDQEQKGIWNVSTPNTTHDTDMTRTRTMGETRVVAETRTGTRTETRTAVATDTSTSSNSAMMTKSGSSGPNENSLHTNPKSMLLMSNYDRERFMGQWKSDRTRLITQMKRAIQGFDTAVRQLAGERVRIACDIKATELRFLSLYRELKLLQDMAKQDATLTSKLNKSLTDRNEIEQVMTELKNSLMQKKKEVANCEYLDEELVEKFRELVPDSHEAASDLFRIFKRKIKRRKHTTDGSATGEEQEEENESDSDIDWDESDSDDDEAVEDICPIGCDQTLFEQVLDLRETRLDQEETLQEIRKQLEELEKNYDRQQQRARQVDKDLEVIKQEIRAFQSDKQRRLNQIEVTMTLKASQIYAGFNNIVYANDSIDQDIDSYIHKLPISPTHNGQTKTGSIPSDTKIEATFGDVKIQISSNASNASTLKLKPEENPLNLIAQSNVSSNTNQSTSHNNQLSRIDTLQSSSPMSSTMQTNNNQNFTSVTDGTQVGELPNSLDNFLLMNRSDLLQLRQRITQLKEEIVSLRAGFKHLHKQKTYFQREKSTVETAISETRLRSDDLQMLKFGKVVDLTQLDRISHTKNQERAESELQTLEEQQRKQVEELKLQMHKEQESIISTTRENTQLLEKIAELSTKQVQLEKELNSALEGPSGRKKTNSLNTTFKTTQKTKTGTQKTKTGTQLFNTTLQSTNVGFNQSLGFLQDNQEEQKIELEEQKNLQRQVQTHAKEIEILEQQINMLRYKGRMTHQSVRAPPTQMQLDANSMSSVQLEQKSSTSTFRPHIGTPRTNAANLSKQFPFEGLEKTISMSQRYQSSGHQTALSSSSKQPNKNSTIKKSKQTTQYETNNESSILSSSSSTSGLISTSVQTPVSSPLRYDDTLEVSPSPQQSMNRTESNRSRFERSHFMSDDSMQ